jgi:GT2 family glycosyltransferase
MQDSGHYLPSVTAVIVNYKSGPHAVECIRSLIAQGYPSLSITVVDNASGDESVVLLRSTFGSRIELIESASNLGFGQANNLAASKATTDYLLLVNPDAQLLTEDFTAELINFMERHPAVGIAGPQIHEPSKKHQYVMPRRSYPSQTRLRNQDSLKALPGRYAWILGACMCIRRSLYEEIGGFDPDYFLYGEDIDICLRVRKAGFEVGYCEQAKLTHVGGVSEAAAIPLDKFLRKKRGFFLFCLKHYPVDDVKRIAYMSLVSTYYASLKNRVKKLLRLGQLSMLRNDDQKIKATRIVIREILESLN